MRKYLVLFFCLGAFCIPFGENTPLPNLFGTWTTIVYRSAVSDTFVNTAYGTFNLNSDGTYSYHRDGYGACEPICEDSSDTCPITCWDAFPYAASGTWVASTDSLFFDEAPPSNSPNLPGRQWSIAYSLPALDTMVMTTEGVSETYTLESTSISKPFSMSTPRGKNTASSCFRDVLGRRPPISSETFATAGRQTPLLPAPR